MPADVREEKNRKQVTDPIHSKQQLRPFFAKYAKLLAKMQELPPEDPRDEVVQILAPLTENILRADGMPEILSHYTNFAGLNSILETGELWATYSQTLNDISEEKFGRQLVSGYVTPKIRSEEGKKKLSTVLRLEGRRFVTCFCCSSDVLSMWRYYGNQGGGYCLEFDGPDLQMCKFPQFGAKLLMKMHYGASLSPEMKEFLDAVAECASKGMPYAHEAAFRTLPFVYKLKDQAFHEEQEWRLLVDDPDDPSLYHFREGHGGIKPFLKLRPYKGDGTATRLPLKRIVIGPTLRNDPVLKETIQMMLAKYGYGGLPVEFEKSPIRPI